VHAAAGAPLDRGTPGEVFKADRTDYRSYLRRSSHPIQLMPQKQPSDSNRKFEGRCGIEHDGQSYPRSMNPSGPGDFEQDFTAAGSLGG